VRARRVALGSALDRRADFRQDRRRPGVVQVDSRGVSPGCGPAAGSAL
jgi:hypothetical protein